MRPARNGKSLLSKNPLLLSVPGGGAGVPTVSSYRQSARPGAGSTVQPLWAKPHPGRTRRIRRRAIGRCRLRDSAGWWANLAWGCSCKTVERLRKWQAIVLYRLTGWLAGLRVPLLLAVAGTTKVKHPQKFQLPNASMYCTHSNSTIISLFFAMTIMSLVNPANLHTAS